MRHHLVLLYSFMTSGGASISTLFLYNFVWRHHYFETPLLRHYYFSIYLHIFCAVSAQLKFGFRHFEVWFETFWSVVSDLSNCSFRNLFSKLISESTLRRPWRTLIWCSRYHGYFTFFEVCPFAALAEATSNIAARVHNRYIEKHPDVSNICQSIKTKCRIHIKIRSK